MGFGLFVILLWAVFIWINWYTNHGEETTVPNLKGINFNQATAKLDEANLRYVVFDSIYNPELKKDAVSDQDPMQGSLVKPNRIIYLTVNSLSKPTVKMPKLVDQSFNLSKMLLKKAGLELGEVYFKYDEIGHNLVLEQTIKGKNVPAGKQLDKGTSIDLLVSTNRKNIISDTAEDARVSLKDLEKKWELQKKALEAKAAKAEKKNKS